jgi:hypothetical protein
LPANVIEMSRTAGRAVVRLAAVQAGPDWVVAIYGGDGPHVGAVALAGPGGGGGGRHISLPNHREGGPASAAAAELARSLGAAVSVSCGVHMDGATREEIALVEEAIGILARDLAREIKSPD